MTKILNLHSHSEFSNFSCGFKDTTNKLKELLDYAYNNNHAGIGLTDHESVTGHIQATEWLQDKIKNAETEEEKQKAESFNLVLGNEIYIAREGLDKDNHQQGENFYHFLLLAMDEEGQSQIRKLSSRAWSRGYMKNVMRRFTYMSDLLEIIGSNQGHVVATTACIANLAGVTLATKPIDEARETIDGYMDLLLKIFGEGNIYIELSPAGYTEQKNYNKFMVERYKDKFPFIITNDVHYLTKEDYDTFTVFMKGARRDDVDKYYKYSHFMTESEIRKGLSYLDEDFITKAMNNALEIGNRSERYSLKHDTVIPKVPYNHVNAPSHLIDFAKDYKYVNMFLNSEHEADRVLANRVLKRYSEKENDTIKRRSKIFNRLNLEWEELWGISDIRKQRLADYLLTMEWIISKMWEAGTLVGPGRGSAVAFATNYYLDITDLNPVDYPIEIPHWRFLSATRPELPDIDIDSPGADREMVIEYISKEFEKLGGEVVQVATYGRETSKKAIRSIAAGLDIPLETADYISSLIPSERGQQLSLSQCYYGDEDHAPIKAFVEQMNENEELWKHASKIEGLITQMGTHAGGVIFSNEPIDHNNSIIKSKKGIQMTAYSLHESEDTGLIKYD